MHHDKDEEHHLEIDDFANTQDHHEKHYGMMQAGGEEKVIKQLIRAGTLDSEGNPIGVASPGLKMKQDLMDQNDQEEKKE